ncbi:iron-containing alcohol dehydrogenase [Desulfobaculum senezii]|jgi:alcohol dehydrogenase class IV
MTGWEEKIDINHVFKLQPARPVTYFGVGAVAMITDILKEFTAKGQGRVLVVTDEIAYEASGAWKTVKPALEAEATAFTHYGKVRPNPTYDNCEEAAQAATDMQADVILAIGGGSAMDTAKTAAVLMRHPGKTAKQFYEQGEPIAEAAPIIAINTSHGTGSETDAFAVAQSDGEDKPAINSPHVYPTFTIEDPALTQTMPLKQTISTSIDAMNHALEAATTITTNPYSICLAKDAIRLVAKYLPKAIVEPHNLTARYWLMYSSAIAGISFDIGLLHITHSMEHAMSAINAKVTHGDGLGILMPAMVREIYHATPEVLADILNPIVPDLKGVGGEADYAASQLKKWLNSVGQGTSMNGYFTEADLPELTRMTMDSSLSKLLLPLAPIKVDQTVIERIFRSSF